MSISVGAAVDVVLLMGLLVIGPLWLVSLFQIPRWLTKAECGIRQGARLQDSHPLLAEFLGRSLVLIRPDVLTDEGLAARTATLIWLRRLLFASLVLVVLVVIKEVTHPEPLQQRGNATADAISDATLLNRRAMFHIPLSTSAAVRWKARVSGNNG